MVLLTGEDWTLGATSGNCEFIGMICLRRCDDEIDEAKKKDLRSWVIATAKVRQGGISARCWLQA